MGDQCEIRRGDVRAVVDTTGATLRLLDVGGVAYSQTYRAGQPAPMSSGAVLAPWPNRTVGATWPLDGRPQRLAVTEPARGNALHGLVRPREWTVTAHGESAVTLSTTVADEPGWPFRFETAVTYLVDHRGLSVTHTVANLGDRPMPFGIGAHPYPRPGVADADDCELTLAATTWLPLDPVTMGPSGPQQPASIVGEPLRGKDFDDAFGGCQPGGDGLVRHTLRGRDGGVEVWADPVFRWVQVFTTSVYPGANGRAVAIEPMTCPPDALNSGVDLLTVDPGASWTATWGITPVG